MALPIPPNTTCDIYVPGNTPPTDPDSEAVRCYLKAGYDRGLETGDEASINEADSKFTHIMLVDASITTVEDGHSATVFSIAQCSTAYVPDKDGTRFFVVFVERRHRGTASDHKKLYLIRDAPTWPTDEL